LEWKDDIIPSGLWENLHVFFPRHRTAAGMDRTLPATGVPVLPADLSKFRKMDGSLICLSLRFERNRLIAGRKN
jgi:N-dimethylarginine dimethylaminohydrolase